MATRTTNALRAGFIGLIGLLGVVTANAADNNNPTTLANALLRDNAAVNHSSRAHVETATTTPSAASASRWQLEQNRVYAPPPAHSDNASTSVASVVFQRSPMSSMANESPTTSTVAQSLSGARWDDTPQVIQAAKQFKRRGLPLVHLWESEHALLALGLNQRGRPGLYITQKIGQ
jgi:hypothetical protein